MPFQVCIGNSSATIAHTSHAMASMAAAAAAFAATVTVTIATTIAAAATAAATKTATATRCGQQLISPSLTLWHGPQVLDNAAPTDQLTAEEWAIKYRGTAVVGMLALLLVLGRALHGKLVSL